MSYAYDESRFKIYQNWENFKMVKPFEMDYLINLNNSGFLAQDSLF